MGKIQKIAYLNYDTHLVTIGEKDRSILLWTIEGEAKSVKKEPSNELDDSMSKQEAIDNKLKLLELPYLVPKKTGVDKFGKAPRALDSS